MQTTLGSVASRPVEINDSNFIVFAAVNVRMGLSYPMRRLIDSDISVETTGNPVPALIKAFNA